MSASTNPNQNSNNMSANLAPSGGGGGAGAGIPDLMKIGSIPVNTVQEVLTDVLEPVIKSDTFCRFVFSNKGLLHSHSKIEIGLDNATQDATLPLNIGAYSLIQRVALRVGNQTLCEIDDFPHYYAYRSLFVSNENQKEREQMTTGRAISHCFAYADRSDENGGQTTDPNQANGIALDNGRDALIPSGGATPWNNANFNGTGGTAKIDATALYKPRSWQNLKQDVATDRNLYQLSLSELCPFLRHNQLPLYLMKEQVSLELHFTKAGDANTPSERVSIMGAGSTAGAATAKQSYPIDFNKLRIIADYIFYPQELMLQYANANSVLNFTYADYRLSKYSRSVADLKNQGIRNVGGAGRIVNKLIWGISAGNVNETSLQNNYVSEAASATYAGVPATDTNGLSTFNIKYNDTFEFPQDVKNPARHFHNVNQAEGMVPFVGRQEYSREGVSLTPRFFNGTGVDTLSGRSFWCSQRLTAQQRINSRGIELYFKVSDLPAGDYTQRVYLEMMRSATLSNGYTECYFS